MTKRAKIIIGVLIAVLLGGGVAAAFFASSGVASTKSSNSIKADIEKAFNGKDYFDEVQVKTYSGTQEVEDGNEKADSAAIMVTLNKMDSATFKEAASLMPKLEMTAFYSIGDTTNPENITSVTGFKPSDLQDETTVNAIADSLKVHESYKGIYWQISRGNAEGDDASKMKTQFVTADSDVTNIRKTVDAVLTPKMDVLPVSKTDLSTGSFTQFAAVDGKMENFNKGLELGLKFADEAFLGGEQVAFLGLGDDIQISYNSLRDGLNKEKVTEIAKNLNSEQLFKISVVSPEDTKTSEATPSETATATPTESK